MIIPHYFIYKYNEGPLSLEELRKASYTSGNCRRAIQDYLFRVHHTYVPAENILLPHGYTSVGTFITKDGIVDISSYQKGDIIYAEKVRNKSGKEIYRSKDCFSNETDWIISLHSAIFVNKNTIYHATSIEGGTCTWSYKKFTQFYKIVSVKRVLQLQLK